MYHFKYVTKKEVAPKKKEAIELLHLVQKEVRDKFTLQYEFVGSTKRNMITCDVQSNIGYDFDINIYVNVGKRKYTAKEIKHILMNAFNKYAKRYRYDFCEDNTRVFTIKVKDKKNAKILHSCDFAIVSNCEGSKQKYVRFNKKSNSYTWEEQPEEFYHLPVKIEFCKDNNLWQDVKELYLYKKNTNTEKKDSRSIFADTIHQICQQNGFYN